MRESSYQNFVDSRQKETAFILTKSYHVIITAYLVVLAITWFLKRDREFDNVFLHSKRRYEVIWESGNIYCLSRGKGREEGTIACYLPCFLSSPFEILFSAP